MRPWLLKFLLLSSILIHHAQGIRLVSKGSVTSHGLDSLHNGYNEASTKQEVARKEQDLVVDSSSQTQQLQQTDPDTVDIAAMDYTFARRKPPIHN